MTKRMWVATLVAMGSGLAPGDAGAQEPEPDVVGSWEGVIEVGATRLRVVFHVERDAGGALSGTMDSPDQGAFGIALSEVAVAGGDVTLGVAAAGATFSGTLAESGDEIVGTWAQGPASLPLTLTRAAGTDARPPRPQEPTGPLPYGSTEVEVRNVEAGIALAGTLTVPSGSGPFPGVVLVSGSGPQDRDESLLGHRPFLVLADHLTRNGIAVLRYDDRGVGDSEGDFSAATSVDLTSDALAAVSFLRARPEVAADRVGIVGHSEGGLVGPMAANRSDEVGFVVMLAGPGVPGLEILVEQGRLINRAGGAPEEMVELNARIQRGLAAIVAEEPDSAVAMARMRAFLRGQREGAPATVRETLEASMDDDAVERTAAQFHSPWMRFFLQHDPEPDLERLRVPVLALLGGKDLQVPAGLNEPVIAAAFARGGNPDAAVRTLAGLNHLFQEAETGSPTEYASIEQTMSPIALQAVSAWISERFGSRSP